MKDQSLSRPRPRGGGFFKLSKRDLAEGIRCLTTTDRDLASVVSTYGPPPLWARKPGFSTLLYIILEQQVSLASARAAYNRLVAAVSPLTPARFLTCTDRELKSIGFSRQKAGYGREVSRAILSGELRLSGLGRMGDVAARRELTRIKGIGPWTADIYLLMALRRPDVWPVGDIALAAAAQHVKGLPGRPTPEELMTLGDVWRPWRAVAARILWHHYLSNPGAKVGVESKKSST